MKHHYCRIFPMAVIAMAGPAKNYAPPSEFKEPVAGHDARAHWFRDVHFRMFIHWGLYSQFAGEWRDKPVKARYFRRNISQASDTPVVSEFQPFGN